MKKLFLFCVVAGALTLASCSSISHTAYSDAVNTELYNRTYADLNVSDNVITYKFIPTKAHERAGIKSLKAAAIDKALEANGQGDLLVNPRFEIKKTMSGIQYVIVTGHPATYKNFHNITKEEAEIIDMLKNKKK